MMAGIPAKSATLGLVVEARDAAHAQEIREQLAAGGFPRLMPSPINPLLNAT